MNLLKEMTNDGLFSLFQKTITEINSRTAIHISVSITSQDHLRGLDELGFPFRTHDDEERWESLTWEHKWAVYAYALDLYHEVELRDDELAGALVNCMQMVVADD